MPEDKKFNWSDAWLLLAIIYAGGENDEATLEKIIAAGDAINHAIFNACELESGLARLSAGKFIKQKNEAFSITPKVKRAYAKIALRRLAASKELEAIGEFIGEASPLSEQPQIDNLKYEKFSHHRFREAVDKWLSR